MPYVEGFGTWPFGEEWLWEAVACVYLPLLDVLGGAPVTLGLTPVLCDQLEAMRGEAGDRYLGFLRDVRAPIHAEDAAGLDEAGEPALAAEVRRAATRLHARRRALRGARARPARRLRRARRRGAVDLRRHPRAASAARHRRRPAAPGGDRHRGAPCAASAIGAAASGCPSAPTSRVWSASWPTTACASSASTRRAWPGFDHLSPVATDARPGGGADRLGGGASSSGATSAATPRTAPTATTGAAPSTT